MARSLLIALLCQLVAGQTTGQIKAPAPANGLVAYYSFDASGIPLPDAGGGSCAILANCQALTNGAGPGSQAGEDGSAARYFDGNGGTSMTFPQALTNDVDGGNARSVCMWVYPEEIGEFRGIFQYGTTGASPGGQEFSFATAAPNIYGNTYSLIFGGTLNKDLDLNSFTNVWNHYCLTYGGSAAAGGNQDITLWLGGTKVSAADANADLDTDVNGGGLTFRLGEYEGNGNFYFKGYIDEVYIYSRELNVAEVNALYAAGSTVPANLVDVTSPPSGQPSAAPSGPSAMPSDQPSKQPTAAPSAEPTSEPSPGCRICSSDEPCDTGEFCDFGIGGGGRKPLFGYMSQGCCRPVE